jgi:micrococcal nuclease
MISTKPVRPWRVAGAAVCVAAALTALSCARESSRPDPAAQPKTETTTRSAAASQDAGYVPPPFRAVVEHVDDGDTFGVRVGAQAYRVRLSGVDAPEIGQRFGQESRNRLRTLIFDRTIDVRPVGVDQYGRVLACPVIDGQSVCETMVAEGWAWQYRQYSRDARLAALEQQARAGRLGLWADPTPQPPWEFRTEERTRRGGGMAAGAGTRAATPVAGPFHGNVKSRVYHAPACPDYDCASCTAVFATREAAEKAGFRPHRECVR